MAYIRRVSLSNFMRGVPSHRKGRLLAPLSSRPPTPTTHRARTATLRCECILTLGYDGADIVLRVGKIP